MLILHWVRWDLGDKAVCGRVARMQHVADEQHGVTCRECLRWLEVQRVREGR